MDKSVIPADRDLQDVLGQGYAFWNRIREKVLEKYPVFGQKAFDAILSSSISDAIKTELASARVYAEGRGIRIPVPDEDSLDDIFRLIDFKLAH